MRIQFPLIAALTIFAYSIVLSGTLLTEQQALDTLVSQIQKDRLYSSWTSLSCLSFYIEDKTERYINIAIRERHGGKCPGDPNTSPVVDRFKVNRLTGETQWYNTEGELLPYKAVLKERGIEKK